MGREKKWAIHPILYEDRQELAKDSQELAKDSQEFKGLETHHVATCKINHTTSSEDMEASAAVEMFDSSVENLSLSKFFRKRCLDLLTTWT